MDHGYNDSVRGLAILSTVFIFLTGCPSSGGAPAEQPGADAGATARQEPRKRSAPMADRDEQLRRTEAVRRASEELYARGIKTDDYLINLIVEEKIYKISYVKHEGGKLRRELSVDLRRDDFEVLSVEGVRVPHDEGGDEGPR